MTLRSRRMMPALLAFLLVLALAPSSFAQVQLTLTPTPSPSEITTSHAAQTADPSTVGAGILVTGALLANSPLTTTTLLLTYPTTISSSPGPGGFCDTNSSSTSASLPSGLGNSGPFTAAGATGCPVVPVEDPITIVGGSGVFASLSNANLRLNTNFKRVEIDLPGFPSGQSQSGSFRVTGVRVEMNGVTAPVTATASLGNAANNYLLSTTSYGAVNATGAGIAAVAIGSVSGSPNQGTAAILTNKTVPKGTASVLITGGFAGAWRSVKSPGLSNSGTALTASGENSTRIQLTWGNIPTGVTLTLSVNTTNNSTVGATFVSAGQTTTVTNGAATAVLEITGGKLTSTPSLEIDVTGITLSSSAAVGTPASITMTASMAPFCTSSLDSTFGTPTLANGYPCYTETEVGPVTVVNILPVSTTMLMPYALTLPPYDTGIAIANTTADPFGSSGGGAIATAGTLVFNFFPTTATGGAGTPFSLTTSSTVRPGAGLSSDGTLAAGATYTVLLSQLLTAAGQTGNFTGYIFITANFLDGHGTATISDFRTYSLTANVLVLPPPATFSRSTPGSLASISGAELLHY